MILYKYVCKKKNLGHTESCWSLILYGALLHILLLQNFLYIDDIFLIGPWNKYTSVIVYRTFFSFFLPFFLIFFSFSCFTLQVQPRVENTARSQLHFIMCYESYTNISCNDQDCSLQLYNIYIYIYIYIYVCVCVCVCICVCVCVCVYIYIYIHTYTYI